jgi:hypothetical protein
LSYFSFACTFTALFETASLSLEPERRAPCPAPANSNKAKTGFPLPLTQQRNSSHPHRLPTKFIEKHYKGYGVPFLVGIPTSRVMVESHVRTT